MATPLFAAVRREELDAAAGVLSKAVEAGQVHAAALYVRRADHEFARSFGAARSIDDIFLLASITKPITVAALMTLYDAGQFRLDDPVTRFIPEFSGEGREKIDIRHLLTHTCGLPDQLPENHAIRKRQAPLSEFVARAIRTPLLFEPGSQYRYSSMGILLAAEIAQRISGSSIHDLVEQVVFKPLEMRRSALGLGRFRLEETMLGQLEQAAPESGAGDPSAKQWDWNSPYWRNLGAPWGGGHGSAPDLARFFGEFLHPKGKLFSHATARLMIRNHNPQNFTPRGLGFALGAGASSADCSADTFGHSGSSGTLAWADPATDTICVVLTTLPGNAAKPHPRQLVSDQVARAVRA